MASDAPPPPGSQPPSRPRRRVVWPWIAAAAVLVVPALWVFNRQIPPPAALGLQNGRLAPCPGSPNCVASESSDGIHRVEPLRWTGSAESAGSRLRQVLQGMRGARLITDRTDYLHVEFRTRLLGFVDDVEFRLDAPAGVFHVRSASRLGHSDLGTNRRRVEEIRRRFGG